MTKYIQSVTAGSQSVTSVTAYIQSLTSVMAYIQSITSVTALILLCIFTGVNSSIYSYLVTTARELDVVCRKCQPASTITQKL